MKIIAAILACAAVQEAAAFVGPSVSQSRVSTQLFEEAVDTEAAEETMGASAMSALTSDVKTVFTTEDIDKILPHRYPFALVDKVVEYEAGKVRIVKKSGLSSWL